MLLGFSWVLKDSQLPWMSIQNWQSRAVTLAGIFGLAYVGLSLYGVFGVFHSVLAASVFNFIRNLVAGMSLAMSISVFRPKSVKLVLGISGLLFIGINLLVITHQHLRPSGTSVRGFYSLDGLLLGISLISAIFLWWRARFHY
jgi:FtsH-binding integral membrane protein